MTPPLATYPLMMLLIFQNTSNYAIFPFNPFNVGPLQQDEVQYPDMSYDLGGCCPPL